MMMMIFIMLCKFVQILAPGMLILGCVKEVHEYSLSISLPNNLTGTVALTQISPAYTEQLQRLSQMSEEDLLSEDTVSQTCSKLQRT